MWNRVELKMRGKQAFQYNYWPCVGAAFIMSVISMVFNSGGAGQMCIRDRMRTDT